VLAPTAGEANAAGPWVIEELSPEVFGVSRVGMGYARGYVPTAIFLDRWLALVAAAVLPGLGQTPLLIRRKREDGGHGYQVMVNLLGGTEFEVGCFGPAAKRLVRRMNAAIYLLRSPESMARLLKAAGAVGLERTGAILDEQLSEEDELAGKARRGPPPACWWLATLFKLAAPPPWLDISGTRCYRIFRSTRYLPPLEEVTDGRPAELRGLPVAISFGNAP